MSLILAPFVNPSEAKSSSLQHLSAAMSISSRAKSSPYCVKFRSSSVCFSSGSKGEEPLAGAFSVAAEAFAASSPVAFCCGSSALVALSVASKALALDSLLDGLVLARPAFSPPALPVAPAPPFAFASSSRSRRRLKNPCSTSTANWRLQRSWKYAKPTQTAQRQSRRRDQMKSPYTRSDRRQRATHWLGHEKRQNLQHPSPAPQTSLALAPAAGATANLTTAPN